MTEYIDGLYTLDYGRSADILSDGRISSGYSSVDSKPLFSIVVKIFYESKLEWEEDPDCFDEYFVDPKLIAPINLIKWKTKHEN